jgi:translation elongation factor EF-G
MPHEPGKIRNVAVVGHRGTGKTSLVEAMLFQAGAINRLGTVEAGTTTSDWTRTSSAGRCPSPRRFPTSTGRDGRST